MNSGDTHIIATYVASPAMVPSTHAARPTTPASISTIAPRPANGIFGAQPALEISDDDWRRYFEVNVLSAARLIRTFLPGMTERGWGRVLDIASDSAVAIPAEMIHYGMSKTALLAVSRGFAKEASGTGVTVNSVIAGPTHTEGVEDFVRSLVGDDLPWDEAQARSCRNTDPTRCSSA